MVQNSLSHWNMKQFVVNQLTIHKKSLVTLVIIIGLSLFSIQVAKLFSPPQPLTYHSKAENNKSQVHSGITRSRNGVIAVPYAMNDYENCNPKTLKTPSDPTKDCFTYWGTLPATRSDYYLGSFGTFQPIMWKEIQTGPNQFNWGKVDRMLQDAGQMEIKDTAGNILKYKPVILVFGTFLQSDGNPHDNSKDMIDYTPDFIKNEVGAQHFTTTLPGCDTQDISPWHIGVWKTYYRNFIFEAARHLKGSPNLYVVQAIGMSGGVSDETTATKNLADCSYKTVYMNEHGEEYNQFMIEQLRWYHDAFKKDGSDEHIRPIYLQAAAAGGNLRVRYEDEARKLGVGLKMNSLAPGNENSYNTKTAYAAAGKGALYDFIDMLNFSIPIAFEPQYPHTTPNNDFCDAVYCNPANAAYQFTYWNFLTALTHKADFADFQKVHLFRKTEMKIKFGIDWLDELSEESFGKTPNQSRIAWIAFADNFIAHPVYYGNKPPAPLIPGQGDYYRYEFSERGDREFYLYRIEETEDSSMIRTNGGFLADGTENYAVRTNSCARSVQNSTSVFITGQDLRSTYLAPNQFEHPFSTGARRTDKNTQNYFIPLKLEQATAIEPAQNVSVAVYYLDFGSGTFSIDYTDRSGTLKHEIVQKTNTKTWKSHTFQLTKQQYRFNGGLSGSADIRLNCRCGTESPNANDNDDDVFHMVKVIADSSAVSETPSHTQYLCNAGPIPTNTMPTVAVPSATPPISQTPSPTNPATSPTASPSAGVTPPGASPTASPSGSIPLPTPSPEQGAVTLNIRLKLQGSRQPSGSPSAQITGKITLTKTNYTPVVQQVIFRQSSDGYWNGSALFENISLDSGYQLFIKGEKHLQRKICDLQPVEQTLKEYSCANRTLTFDSLGTYTVNATGIYQIAGDLPVQDGLVNARDVALIRTNLGSTDPSVLTQADLNFDGIVDTQDYSLILEGLRIREDDPL